MAIPSWVRRLRTFDYVVAAGIAGFSWWLMASTFSYLPKNGGEFAIASHLWSDFGAHIPLIRSFSRGINWPPESPLFPGEPIRYHFLLYALAGWLERAGVRIDWALNIPSAIGFAGMLLGIYAIGARIFRNRWVGFLAVLFTMFNGTFSFVEFFAKHPLSVRTPTDILTNTAFPSFGPWDGHTVSAFWSLNIFTNQRHLAPGYALALAVILMLEATAVSPHRKIRDTVVVVALATAVLFFLNQAVVAILGLWFVWYFIADKKTRLPLVAAGLLVLPIAVMARVLIAPSGTPAVDPWYLVARPVTALGVLRYWSMNLGLHLVLLPVGIALAPKRARFLAIPLLPLFIIPNIVRFSPDMINNHKFFNFFILIAALFSAQTIVRLWDGHMAAKSWTKPWSTVIPYGCRLAAVPLTGLLVLSGIIDFFPVARDYRIGLPDGSNPDVVAITRIVPPGTIVLNSTFFDHPASLAGRPVFFGYPYFTWSYGYDKDEREKTFLAIYRAGTMREACGILQRERIGFVELSDHPDDYIHPNTALFQRFSEVYRNDDSGLTLYDVATSCRTVNGHVTL
jgi:hypothetical protein